VYNIVGMRDINVYIQMYNVCSLHRNLSLKGRPWGGAYYLPSHHATIKGSNNYCSLLWPSGRPCGECQGGKFLCTMLLGLGSNSCVRYC
jgi:hypothetical protein